MSQYKTSNTLAYTLYSGSESIRVGFEWMDVVTLGLLRRAGCYWLVYVLSVYSVLTLYAE